MSHELIRLLSLTIINMALAGFVYLKEREKLASKLFALFTFSIAGWTFALIWAKYGNLFWGRMAFASAGIMPLGFLWFTEVFPEKNKIHFGKRLIAFTFWGIFIIVLSFSPLIVYRLQQLDKEQYRPVYGPAQPLWGIYLLFYLGYSFLKLAKKWRKFGGIYRLQIKYIFLGLLLFCVGATTTNLIIPTLFDFHQLNIYGPYFTLFLVGFTAHAIIRYRLMDIKAVISKGMIYFLSSVISVIILLVLAFPVRKVLAPDIDIPTEALIVVTALSSIIIFYSMKYLFHNLLEKYFYHEPYNYQRILRNASQALSVLQFRELLNYLSKMIVKQMKVESASIFLEKKGFFQCQSIERYFSLDSKDKDLTSIQKLSEKHSYLIRELQRRMEMSSGQERFLVREELARQFEDDTAQSISEELSSLEYDAVYPLTFENRLIGVLFVGSKLSGEPYFQPDLDLLSTVSNQAGIAIRNAQLYTEVNRMKEYTESILSEMESGVITVNSKRIITIFNDAAKRLTGIDKREAIGKKVTVLGSEFSGLILDVLNNKKLSSHNETTIKTQSRQEIPIIFSTSCLKDEQGEISDCVLVFSDISKIKETEEKRQKLQRLAILGSLASGILHEIKNSLLPLRTFAELLPENYSDPDFRDSYSKIVLNEIDQVNSLFNQLRDLAHFSPPEFAKTNLFFPIENALSLLKAKIEKSNIQVIKEYTQELPEIMADETKLRQLFLNLFINSLQFMSDGGKLRIKTSVRDSSNSKYLFVEVSDTGPGIEESDLERIFNPFFTTREEGTGLGLTICQNIVDSHKGNISIQNNEKEGVTVTVSFPIKD